MSTIVDKKNALSYTWGNNCLSWVLQGGKDLSIKQEVMPAGTKEQWHYHQEATQFFYVLHGEATFYLEHEVHHLSSHQGIAVPSTQKHRISNESNAHLEFLVISQPATDGDRINVDEVAGG